MTWLNPLGWIGLAAIALPILIHLLGQGRPRRQRFPTLRFFGVTRPLPTSRTRIHDLILLLVRIAIIIAATAAIAKPLFNSGPRQRSAGQSLHRAVIIDTSASMLRVTPSGESARQAAERLAKQIGDSASTHTILSSANPSEAIDGAVAWLGRQDGIGELVLISDFQAGMLSAADLSRIPASIGVRIEHVVVRPHEIDSTQFLVNGSVVDATSRTTSNGIDITWSGASRVIANPILLRTGASQSAAADAARRAADVVGVAMPIDTAHHVAIVYRDADVLDSIRKIITPLRAPWMLATALQLRRDSLLADIAADAAVSDSAPANNLLVIARSANGTPVVLAGAALLNGGDHLVLLPLTDESSLTSAALIAAATRAMSNAPTVAERGAESIPDSALRAWQRAPSKSAVVTAVDSDASDGRWLWIAALVLLVIETLIRRTPPRTIALADDAAR
jgi:hypothetical protein